MWRAALYLFFLTGLASPGLMSQNADREGYAGYPLRIEIPARSVNETYRVIPVGGRGLILFYRSLEAEDELRTRWYFTRYDTNLQQIWVKSVPIYNDLDFKLSQTDSDTLALLFGRGERSKNPENFYQVLRIVPAKGLLVLNAGKIDDGASIVGFSVGRGQAWLGLSVKGQTSKILNTRLRDGISHTFTPGVGGQLDILWMKADSATGYLSAVVSRQISKKDIEYYLVRYDTNGVIRRETPLATQPGGCTLNNMSLVTTKSGGELLLGSYRLGAVRSSSKNNLPGESTGLFASPVIGGSQKSVSFYNFLELKSAPAIAGESDMMDLQRKAQKKQKKISDFSLDYSVLLHEIKAVNGQFVLAAELFSPQYHTENFTDFDFYGRPYTNSYSVFDGYRFFHAVVAGFDDSGTLLWDNSIEIRNLVSAELNPKISVYPAGTGDVLCYVSDGKIGSKIIRENDVVEKLDFAPLDLFHPDDKLISESKSYLVHWYRNYFLTYGYQDIKNIALESNNKRLVFQFTKIRFD